MACVGCPRLFAQHVRAAANHLGSTVIADRSAADGAGCTTHVAPPSRPCEVRLRVHTQRPAVASRQVYGTQPPTLNTHVHTCSRRGRLWLRAGSPSHRASAIAQQHINHIESGLVRAVPQTLTGQSPRGFNVRMYTQFTYKSSVLSNTKLHCMRTGGNQDTTTGHSQPQGPPPAHFIGRHRLACCCALGCRP